MRNVADEIPKVDIDSVWFNLIPSRFPPIEVFRRICGVHSHDAIAELESMTNPRLREKKRVQGEIYAVDSNQPHLQNWNHAPFTYSNPEGSHFFKPSHPVLELSDSLQTALAVSVRKRSLFLKRTSEGPTNLDMRVLTRTVKGKFWNLTEESEESRAMDRWDIGDELIVHGGLDGVVFRAPERPSARRIAILNGRTLGHAKQSDHYRFVWDGEHMESLYSFTEGEKINPNELAYEECAFEKSTKHYK